MRKFKLDKKTSIRISALAMAGMIFVTSISLQFCRFKKKRLELIQVFLFMVSGTLINFEATV